MLRTDAVFFFAAALVAVLIAKLIVYNVPQGQEWF